MTLEKRLTPEDLSGWMDGIEDVRHCADNVTKDACDNLGGKFNPSGQC